MEASFLLVEWLPMERPTKLDPGKQIPVLDLMDVHDLQLMAGSGMNGLSMQVLQKELVLEEPSVYT